MKRARVEFWGYYFPDYEDFVSIHDIIKKKFGDEKPDYIFQFHACGKIPDLYTITDIPVVQVVSESDFLYDPKYWLEDWNKVNMKLLLFRIWSTTSHVWRTKLREQGYGIREGDTYGEWDMMARYKEVCKCPVVSFPHCFDPEIYKDYGLPKTYDLSIMGRRSYQYPIRNKGIEIGVSQKFRDKGYKFGFSNGLAYNNEWKDPNGFMRTENRMQGNLWGDEYARRINETKIFVTDGTYLNVAVPKYFEIQPSRCMMMAPLPDNWEELHFQDGVNMVDVNVENVEEKLFYYLENESEMKKITDAGYEMAHKYHTAKVRVDELFKLLDEYC
jgi:glycosyltransferase involved in cell wall biosynthesis